MFTVPLAAGEAVPVVGVARGGAVAAGTDPADADGAGQVAAWANPCEWVILGRRSQ